MYMKYLLDIELPVILFGAHVHEDVAHNILERDDI